MQRKLTIRVTDEVYRGLKQKVERREISRFIENLIRPHVAPDTDLEGTYQEMAADTEREQEALEWLES